jgi:hypothetical protein
MSAEELIHKGHDCSVRAAPFLVDCLARLAIQALPVLQHARLLGSNNALLDPDYVPALVMDHICQNQSEAM